MKKLLLSIIVASLFAPALSVAETATVPVNTPAAPAAIPHSATVEAAQDKAAAAPVAPATVPETKTVKAKKAGGPKVCNPKKSKPCGKGCIPLARTCKKK